MRYCLGNIGFGSLIEKLPSGLTLSRKAGVFGQLLKPRRLSFPRPRGGLLRIARQAQFAVPIRLRQPLGCFRMPAGDGPLQPSHSLPVVAGDPATFRVGQSDLVLGRRIAAFGQPAKPVKGQLRRGLYALAPPVGFRQPVLSSDIVLPGRFIERVGRQCGWRGRPKPKR